MHTYTGEIASTVCAVFWALALIFFFRSGREVPPPWLNLFKNLVAIPLLLATVLITGEELLPAYGIWNYGALVVSGLIGLAVADTVLFASMNRVGAGWTAVISCTYSPMAILVTAVGFGVPLTAAVGFGTVLVVAAMLLAGKTPRGAHVHGRLVTGIVLGVLAQLLMILPVAMLKYPLWGHPPVFEVTNILVVAFWRVVFGTALLALGLFIHPRHRGYFSYLAPSPAWRWMIPGAILGSYLAMVTWIIGMAAITGSLARAAILNQTTTIFLPIFAAIFLHEPITRRKAAAILLAFVGASVVVLGRHSVGG